MNLARNVAVLALQEDLPATARHILATFAASRSRSRPNPLTP